LRAIIAGGGTAGHINPAISIARQIKCMCAGSEILFIGTKRGLEAALVPESGFNIDFIRVRGFKRKLSLETLATIKELIAGFLQARRAIKKFRPDIVIGTGGYVCGPVLFAAAMMKIPTLIHEQNAFPGITNRILSRFVDAVAVSFKESEAYFRNAERLIRSGNPVRPEIIKAKRHASRQKLGYSEGKPLVVVVGGSLGAEKINDTVVKMILKYYTGHDFYLLFATGKARYGKIMAQLEGISHASLKVVPYINDAADVYSSADLMVCRAGAITCSELAVLGVPSIMIPSPNVVENHQEYNARAFEKHGASVVVLEKDLDEKLLYNKIIELVYDKPRLDLMSKNAKKIGVADAAEKICAAALELTGKKA